MEKQPKLQSLPITSKLCCLDLGLLRYDNHEVQIYLVLDAANKVVGQGCWRILDIAEILFQTTDGDKARSRVTAAAKQVEACHERIWPEMAVPLPSAKFDLNDKRAAIASTMTTSYFFALLLRLFSNLHRDSEDRQTAAKMLHWLIDKVREPELTILHFRPNGQFCYKKVTVQRDGCLDFPWDPEYLDYMGHLWDSALTSAEIPWISSAKQRPKLGDYILFGLDPPRKKSRDRVLKTVKLELERSALMLLSQIAQNIDGNLMEMTREPTGQLLRLQGGSQKRVSTEYANAITAEVADMIFAEEDR